MFDSSINIEIIQGYSLAFIARLAAAEVVKTLQHKPDAIIGFSYDGTQEPVCQELVQIYRAPYGALTFRHARFVNLRECVGLEDGHQQSCMRDMNEHFFKSVDVKPENIFIPNCMASNPHDEARRYSDTLLRLGTRDIQLTSVGIDGRLGSSAPGATIRMDLRWILDCHRLLCLASGKEKILPVSAVLGTEDSDMQVRMLRQHPNGALLIDHEACPYDWKIVQSHIVERVRADVKRIGEANLLKRMSPVVFGPEF